MYKVMIAGLLVLGIGGACGAESNSEPVVQAPQDGYVKALAEWNRSVDEWNRLTIERDNAGQSTVVVNGVEYEDYQSWAKANGKPLSFDEVCDRTTGCR